MDLSIVVPCYNEVGNVPKLQSQFLPVLLDLAETQSVEVVFVDDGSTDGTWTALTKAFGSRERPRIAFRFERHASNRGLGAALRTGFSRARGDVIMTTDSDGTYKFSELPRLLACLNPEIDMVTASPYHPDGDVVGVPAYRLVLSRGSSMIYRLLVNWHVYTYTSLFRAYRRQVVDNVPFASDGFLAGTEILVNGMLMGYRVAEYPALLHSRAWGSSKAKIARTILAHLGYQGRILLHRLRLKPCVAAREATQG
jgi:dolichol-phosphate mannosyltransferase